VLLIETCSGLIIRPILLPREPTGNADSKQGIDFAYYLKELYRQGNNNI